MGFVNNALAWLGFREQRDLTVENFYTGAEIPLFDVNQDNALKLMPVYAAVDLIASSWAMLTANLFLDLGDSQQKVAKPDWLRRPDARITWFDWVFQCASSLLLRGNAYGFVIRNAFGAIIGVRWIHPRHVHVDEKGTFPVYYIGGEPYSGYDIGGDIFHLRGFTLPGSVVGLSPVALFQTQFETARSAVEYGHEWFENPVPAGVLKNDKSQLTQEQMDEAKLRFKTSVKRGEPVALDMNWTWQQVSLSPSEAQFLLTIKASASQIASIYHVDPEDIGGEAGNSLKYSTVEGNQRKFNIRTLMPWTIAFEQAIEILLPPSHFLKLDLETLARPNVLDRARTDTERLRNGSVTLQEVRGDLDRRPLTPAEIEFWQTNYLTQKTASESISEAVSTSITQQE